MRTPFNRPTMLAFVVAFAWAVPALAEDRPNPECLGTRCGAPLTEGGGGCGCGCGCSVWVRYTDDGVQLSFTDDYDQDGISDGNDNCPFIANRDQADNDGDGVGDVCDNCPHTFNPDQRRTNPSARWPDGRPMGDACNPDIDGDGIVNELDNCPYVFNPDQKNSFGARGRDGKPIGDACNPDIDGDGVPNPIDNCPYWYNPDQRMPDPSLGIVCYRDEDGDGVEDSSDNCPHVYNPDQKVSVRDPLGLDNRGDACQPDFDHDGVANEEDSCPYVFNPKQENSTGAPQGDACNTQPWIIYAGPRNSKGVAENGDPLNLRGPFACSGGGKFTVPPGSSKLILGLWCNRNGAALEYKYEVTKSPSGKAAVQNPHGYVTQSAHNQYIFPEDAPPTIMGLEPGDYEVAVSTTLQGLDRAYPEITNSRAVVSIHVDDTPGRHGFGCAAIPAAAPAVGLGLALLALMRRRRQRK